MTSDTLAGRGALNEALADLRNAVDGGQPWHPRDFETFTPKRAQTVATILNAVIDGALVSTALASSPEVQALIAAERGRIVEVIEKAEKPGNRWISRKAVLSAIEAAALKGA